MNGAHGTQHFALLIGVGKYANADMLAPLAGPSVDLRSMQAALEHPQIGGYTVSTLEDVDSQSACTRIEEFLSNRGEDETVLLYYSGHGFIDRRGALYLCTTNSSFATPRASSIRADFLTDLIDNCSSKRVLLLLDCCYSGNFEGAAKAVSVIEPQFKGTGLGRVVLTAGATDQLAWDNGAAGSLFSRHVVKGLTTGAADLDQDGRITVQELYDYVYREVTKEQPRQRPGKWTYREDGPSFLIAQSPIQPKRELPAELLRELHSDFARTRVAVLQELERYAARQAWAREPVIENLRMALTDDSDAVKAAAREILARMSAATAPPAALPARSHEPAPAMARAPPADAVVPRVKPIRTRPSRPRPTEVDPPDSPAPAQAAQPTVTRDDVTPSPTSEGEEKFPLKLEIFLWLGVALTLPQLTMRISWVLVYVSSGIIVLPTVLLTALVFGGWLAVRYEVVDGPRKLFVNRKFIIATAAVVGFAALSLLVRL